MGMMVILAFQVDAQELTATEIIKKADAVMKGFESTYSEMTVTTTRPKWSRDMTLKAWTKGDDLTIMVIGSPAKDEGTAFLMHDKEVWNWVPAVSRTIKMPPSMMMQSWMGTDLTNDDLVQQSSIIKDYEHNLIGNDAVDGRECYQIELIPNEDAAVAWGKILMWVDKDEFFQLQTEFYDEDDDMVNLMTASDIREMGGKKVTARMEVIPVDKKNQKTIIQYTDLKFDIGVDDDFFTIQNMKRLK